MSFQDCKIGKSECGAFLQDDAVALVNFVMLFGLPDARARLNDESK